MRTYIDEYRYSESIGGSIAHIAIAGVEQMRALRMRVAENREKDAADRLIPSESAAQGRACCHAQRRGETIVFAVSIREKGARPDKQVVI
jgi:hypothetical protein